MAKTTFGIGLLLVLPFYSSIAHAEDCTAPCFSYDLTLSAFGESVLVTKPKNLKDSTVISPSNSLSLTATPVDGLSFVADFVNESVVDAVPGKTKVFKGIGLYADELYAEYSGDNFSIQAGKFGPPSAIVLTSWPPTSPFRKAAAVAAISSLPGYGAELSADYALSDTWTAHAGYSYFDSGEHEAAHFLNVALTYEVTGPATDKP